MNQHDLKHKSTEFEKFDLDIRLILQNNNEWENLPLVLLNNKKMKVKSMLKCNLKKLTAIHA